MEVVDAIQMAAEVYAARCGLDSHAANFLALALREALVNAIEHGNRGNPDRRVKLSFQTDGRRNLVFTVRDEGRGFDPSRLPNPLAAENLTRGSGRGVFYMRQFADAISFAFPKRGGTVVRLRKRLPPELPPQESELGSGGDP